MLSILISSELLQPIELPMTNQLSEGDLQLIESLRLAPKSISELGEALDVSANAVRQRLNRLMAADLISRQTRVEGRGRPHHQYELTNSGRRTAGDNLPDLAKALWREIEAIEDPKIRQALLTGAMRRLLESYESEVVGQTIEDRLVSIQKFFDDRGVPISIERNDGDGQPTGLPTLRVLECPYPDIDDPDNHFCELEKQLFAKVVGSPVSLCQCRKDGDSCCSFESAEKSLESAPQT